MLIKCQSWEQQLKLKLGKHKLTHATNVREEGLSWSLGARAPTAKCAPETEVAVSPF